MLYKDEILDHYRHPQNFGKLDHPTHQGEMVNASCGDEISVELVVDGDTVSDVKFTGSGCAMSMASASVLSEYIKGKKISQIEALGMADIVSLIGEVNPGRQKCVLLPLKAITTALKINDSTAT